MRWVFVRNKNFSMVILFLLVNCWMTWNMFLLEHWKNSDYFILSVKASGWRAYCFQTLLKMEHIRKGWENIYFYTYYNTRDLTVLAGKLKFISPAKNKYIGRPYFFSISSPVHTIYQSSTKYIKLWNLISKSHTEIQNTKKAIPWW